MKVIQQQQKAIIFIILLLVLIFAVGYLALQKFKSIESFTSGETLPHASNVKSIYIQNLIPPNGGNYLEIAGLIVYDEKGNVIPLTGGKVEQSSDYYDRKAEKALLLSEKNRGRTMNDVLSISNIFSRDGKATSVFKGIKNNDADAKPLTGNTWFVNGSHTYTHAQPFKYPGRWQYTFPSAVKVSAVEYFGRNPISNARAERRRHIAFYLLGAPKEEIKKYAYVDASMNIIKKGVYFNNDAEAQSDDNEAHRVFTVGDPAKLIDGYASASKIVKNTFKAFTPPATLKPPLDVQADFKDLSGDRLVELSWKAPINSEMPVIKYKVKWWATSTGSESRSQTIDVYENETILQGPFDENTNYTVKVLSVDAYGNESLLSPTSTFFVPPMPTEPEPESLPPISTPIPTPTPTPTPTPLPSLGPTPTPTPTPTPLPTPTTPPVTQTEATVTTGALYNVTSNNWLTFVKNKVQNAISATFQVGVDGGGVTQPAAGCKKMFTSTYKCGSDPRIKTLEIPAEAWGKIATFNCVNEEKRCADVRLYVLNSGNVTLIDTNTEKVIWESGTNKVGVPSPQYSAEKSKYKRNFLIPGDTLSVGEFVGSPSGNCHLMMVEDTATGDKGLQLRYLLSGCTDEANATSNKIRLFTIDKQDNSSRGKAGYVDADGVMHEYPSELLSNGSTFEKIGSYLSPGNTLASSLTDNRAACETKCKERNDCAGYVYNNDTKPRIRYVKIVNKPNEQDNYIQVSQVAVYSNNVNVALGKPANSANVYYGIPYNSPNSASPTIAVDGTMAPRDLPNIYRSAGPTASTTSATASSADFWQVDLANTYAIDRIVYYNRTPQTPRVIRAGSWGAPTVAMSTYQLGSAARTQMQLLDASGNIVKAIDLTDEQVQPYDFTVEYNCELKSAQGWPMSGTRVPSETAELYSRNKNVRNHLSCSKVVESISPQQWQLYNIGDRMSMDKLCGLSAYTRAQKLKMDQDAAGLDSLATTMKARLNNLTQQRTAMATSLDDYVESIGDNIDTYDKLVQRKNKYSSETPNWDGMTEDSGLTMVSDMYKNVAWSILAIILVIGANKALRTFRENE